jgi:hypothetical protein
MPAVSLVALHIALAWRSCSDALHPGRRGMQLWLLRCAGDVSVPLRSWLASGVGTNGVQRMGTGSVPYMAADAEWRSSMLPLMWPISCLLSYSDFGNYLSLAVACGKLPYERVTTHQSPLVPIRGMELKESDAHVVGCFG